MIEPFAFQEDHCGKALGVNTEAIHRFTALFSWLKV